MPAVAVTLAPPAACVGGGTLGAATGERVGVNVHLTREERIRAEYRAVVVLRWTSRVLAIGVVLLFALLAVRAGSPETPEGPGREEWLQYSFLGVAAVGAAIAWRWELRGGVLLVTSGAVLGAAATVELAVPRALAVMLAFAAPGSCFVATWAWRRPFLPVAVAAAGVAMLLGGGVVGARQVHAHYFGPTHPQSTVAAPPAGPIEWMWAGAVTHEAVTVRARIRREGARVRLVVSADRALSEPRYSAVVIADAGTYGVATIVAAGLEPDTRYFYALEVDGVLQRERPGRFTTFPRGPASFTVAVGSCARGGSNGAVFDAIRQAEPLLYLMVGDIHYGNIGVDDRALFRAALGAALTAPAQAALYGSVPIAYVWDDHDFGPNNAHGGSPGRAAAQLTYRDYVPHYPPGAPGNAAPIYQAFSVGRVRFVMLDVRSERVPGGSMLGPEQHAWLRGELLAARDTHALTVLASPVPWIAQPSAGGDDWGGFPEERRELADFIADNGIRNLAMLSGDAHMLAIDDGSHSDYSSVQAGGFPVFHAAALDRPGSVKGGPYSEGTFPGGGQFGLMTIEDAGDRITIHWSGRNYAGAELVSYRFSFPVDAADGTP